MSILVIVNSNYLLLIKGCINGDRKYQEQLYKYFAPIMMVICLRYSKNREEAEDVLQEGFMKVFTKIDQFKNEGSFEGWMKKIMVNCALNKYKLSKRMHIVTDIEDDVKDIVDDEQIYQNIEVKELLILVQALPEMYRLIFNLYVLEGLKHKEISTLLGIAEGTSKSNLFDARKILQNEILKKNKTLTNNFILNG